MHGQGFFTPLRVLSYIVLGAMLAAMLYSGWISVSHWTGIGV